MSLGLGYIRPAPSLTAGAERAAVLDRIHLAMFRFETRQGSKPSAIYLGTAEYHEMRRIFERDASIISPASCEYSENCRMEYCGIPVFRVDAKSHLAVG